MSGRVAITPAVADILAQATIEGRVLKLPAGQVDRSRYVALDNVLKALGGKWDRKAGGHSFAFDPSEKLAEALGNGKAVSRQQTLQLFETPEALADRLVAKLDICRDDVCLEPSAGRGRIVAALSKCDPQTIVAVEIDPLNGADLLTQGLARPVICQDFLTYTQSGFMKIAMNPPFTKNQDIRHVRHAHGLLREGGRLAAIVSEHGFMGQERECVEWREWLAELGASIEIIPAGAFKESGTGIQTRMVTLTKTGPRP